MPSDSEQLLDELLVLRWQAGERKAMDALVGRWQKRLWQHAHRLTRDPETAWDATQEAWMGMLKTIGRLDDPRRFPYWAYRTVTHKVCDLIRRKQKVRSGHSGEEIDIPDGRAGPAEHVAHQDSIEGLLASLTLEHRTVVALRFLEDFSVAEIAEILDLPEGTVKSRLHYAKEILKQHYLKGARS